MPRKFQRNSLEEAFKLLDNLDERIFHLINRKETTLPFRDANNLPPGIEGQVVIAESTQEISPLDLTRNLTELGEGSNVSTLATTYAMSPQRASSRAGDGILVCACAPSTPSVGAPAGKPVSCTDSQGNTYSLVTGSDAKWEASTPAVNEGVRMAFFFCPESATRLVKNTDTITVTWDNQVYDRQINAWAVTHSGGANVPEVLARTADNDTTTYAGTSVTITTPAWTPSRDHAMHLGIALVVVDPAPASFSFGGVGGYSGYYLPTGQVKSWVGAARQRYWYFPTTYGSNVLVIVQSTDPQYQLDLGFLPDTLQASFNGFGINFGPGTTANNRWKGIQIIGLD